jgi:hypothetical protein
MGLEKLGSYVAGLFAETGKGSSLLITGTSYFFFINLVI